MLTCDLATTSSLAVIVYSDGKAVRFNRAFDEAGEMQRDIVIEFADEQDRINYLGSMMIDGNCRGWRYESDDEHSDEDCRKISHWAVNVETGERKLLDLSPYIRDCPGYLFRAMVLLGFPSRITGGPLTPAQVTRLLEERKKHGGL